MGSKAFTEKNRDLWMGRGIGCWLGLFALFLFLLPAQGVERFYAFGNQRASVSVMRYTLQGRGVGDAGAFLRGLHRGLRHMLIRDLSGTSDPPNQAKSL